MDDKPLQALANKLKTPAQESQRNGFFRLQQVIKTSPALPVNHQGPLPDIARTYSPTQPAALT